jgi:hypothetical protein
MLRYTNIQKVVNHTVQNILFTIKVDGKSAKTYTIRAATTENIKASRSGFGHVDARVTLMYENGLEYKYKFSVTVRDCTDIVDIYEDGVKYNGKVRGNFTETPALVFIDATMEPLIKFVSTPDPVLDQLRQKVLEKFPEFTKEYISGLTHEELLAFL